MLDIHCHILPGVDDGPRSLDESLAMARFCAEDGITHIVATPHCHRHLRLMRDDIVPHVARLNQALRREGVRLTIWPGAEIQLTDVPDYRADYEAGRFCHLGDDPAFTLLEFSWQEPQVPADAPGQIRWLRAHGTTPIIAHPERHGFFRDDPDRLRALVEAGAWLQVTVDSLLGNHGPQARTAGEGLLRTYDDAVLATDAHRTSRCSGLSVGYQLVQDEFGAARAEDLRARADHILQHLLKVRGEHGDA